MTKSLRNWLDQSLLLYIPLFIVLVCILTPLSWVIVNAFKVNTEIVNGASRYLPKTFTWSNFSYVWNTSSFSVFFKNSLFIGCISVLIIVLLTVANGYALSRFSFRGKNLFMIIIVCTQFIPVIMLLVPQFIIYKSLGLINTPYALIISNVAWAIPFNTLMMTSFISSVPVQIDEAAMVDGASRFRIILTIIPRIILPGLITVISFAFINSWNEFLSAFTFLNSKSHFTVSIGLKYMIGEFSTNYAGISAASLIAITPPLLLFAYVQKYLVSGLNAGAVKG